MKKSEHNIPDVTRNLVACQHCKIILGPNQADSMGCPNDCAHPDWTGLFSGMISIMHPTQHSWVTRYNGHVNKVPGIYAIDVGGQDEREEYEYEEEGFLDWTQL